MNDFLNNSSNAFTNYSDYKQQVINTFVYAAEHGVIKRVSDLLHQGVPVDAKNDNGFTALYCASYSGEIEAVHLLLQHGADVNSQNWQHFTPLAAACDRKHIDVVKLLLENRANIDAESDEGWTALGLAVYRKSDKIAKLLLSYNATCNSLGCSGCTVLSASVAQGNLDMVLALLRHNADPNVKNQDGSNALTLAAFAGHTHIIEALIRGGANVDIIDVKGRTALMYAALSGQVTSANVLLKHGADVNLRDVTGCSASMLASTSNQQEVFKIIQATTRESAFTHNEKRIAQHSDASNSCASNVTDLRSCLDELDGMVGLQALKAEVEQLIQFIQFQQLRQSKGLSAPKQSLHMVFTGNPGTGKTTVARLIGRIYKGLSVLTKGQTVETDRSGLVAGYLGQTAIKVQEIVQSAIGGILFIDEAYSLTNDQGIAGGDAYGHEAIDTLLKLMEDNRNDLVVIVAGYTEPMQKFIRSNPGLQSRFNKFLHFDDYSPAELVNIFRNFAKQSDYKLSAATELKLNNVFTSHYRNRDETFGNARLARNLFEKAINNHASRMVTAGTMDEESLVTLQPEDIPSI